MCNGSQPRGRGRYDGYGHTAIDSIVDLLGWKRDACQDSYGETRLRTSEVGQVQAGNYIQQLRAGGYAGGTGLLETRAEAIDSTGPTDRYTVHTGPWGTEPGRLSAAEAEE